MDKEINTLDKESLRAYKQRFMSENDRRIICAAIRASDGEILMGIRHYDRIMGRQIEQRVDGKKFSHRHDPDQGFIDQYGKYLTREEAYIIAENNGQLLYPEHCGKGLDGNKLYSEGLY